MSKTSNNNNLGEATQARADNLIKLYQNHFKPGQITTLSEDPQGAAIIAAITEQAEKDTAELIEIAQHQKIKQPPKGTLSAMRSPPEPNDASFDALLARVRVEALEAGVDLMTYLKAEHYEPPLMFGLLKAEYGELRAATAKIDRARKAKGNGGAAASTETEARRERDEGPGEHDKPNAKPKRPTKAKGAPEPTDDRIADVFAEEHRNDLRYVAASGKWLQWQSGCWREEKTLRAYDLIRKTCRAQGIERASMAKMVSAVQTLARADRRLAATIEQWDADSMLLNTPDGVIDLRTGELRRHRPGDYMTMITAVGPRGDCPRWKAFLKQITGGDEALIAYLQRVAGYCLTADTGEQAMFFGYGVGANGKGVFLHTIGRVLGDYSKTAAIETFTETKSDRHPTELARLHSARLVVATETEKGRHWAEARIKMLTGGDVVTAHFMRMDDFEYVPRFKLFFSGNHKPGLRSVGEAMRRRVNMIPFAVVIPKDERDPHFGNRLTDEWPGILQWMIDGCLDWQEFGLAPPEAVTKATDDYFEAQDSFTAWIEECCERDPNAWTMSTPLFASWKAWAEKAGVRFGDIKSFGETMETAGFVWKRKGSGKGYEGLRLAVETPQHWQDDRG